LEEPAADKPEWEDLAAAWISAVAMTAVGAVLLAGALYFGAQLILRLAGGRETLTLSGLGLQVLLIALVGMFGGGMSWRGVAIIRRMLGR
jgi:hypothetical protein